MNSPRTHKCGDLTVTDSGQRVRLSGWVVNVRILGKLAFATIRDSSGVIQLIFHEPHLLTTCRQLKAGWTLRVEGQVTLRRSQDINPDLPTGTLEVQAAVLTVLSRTGEPDWGAETIAPAVQLEAAVRRLLESDGFTDAGEESQIPLPRLLPRYDRIYRISSTPTALRASGRTAVARVLEGASAFSTLNDLRSVVAGLLVEMVSRLPSGQLTGPIPVVSGASPDTPWTLGNGMPETYLVVGLPVTGHPNLRGRDLPITLLAETHADPSGTDPQASTDCLLIVVNGRIVGFGSIRSTDPDPRADVVQPLQTHDPLLWEAIRDALDDDAHCFPHAEFLLDVDLFAEATADRTAETINRFEVETRAGLDLSSLLRIAHRGHTLPRLTPELALADEARRIERWDTEACAAMARSRSARRPADPATADPLAGFRDLLDDFAMTPDVCERLLQVTPGTRARFQRMPEGERFEWVWSILGSDSVRTALTETPTYDLIRHAAELGVITDLKQLTYLDTRSLADLSDVLGKFSQPPSDHRDRTNRIEWLLRQALATTPASFTGLLAALADADDHTTDRIGDMLGTGRSPMLLNAAEEWVCAPSLLPLTFRLAYEPDPITALKEVIRAVAPRILANQAISPEQIAGYVTLAAGEHAPELQGRFADSDPSAVAAGVLHHLFRPVSLTFRQVEASLVEVRDCSRHIEDSGLHPGGAHWRPDRDCYQVATSTNPGGALRLHLAKNVPSFLAKGSVGMCTAGDVDLYQRRDHHHLNIVDAVSGLVIGNAQLHLLTNQGQRVLLIRAINASSAYLARGSAHTVVEATILACMELASNSGLDEIHLGDGLSFWHLNSSRPEIRAVLDRIYHQLETVILDKPFFLFRFGRVDLDITKTYRLWTRHGTTSESFRVRHSMEVVT
jgi:hypothetical protein